MTAVSGHLRGQRVREERRKRGWSQKELAKKAGVSPSFVGNLEGDTYQKPHPGNLRSVEKALGLSDGDLDAVPPMIDSSTADEIRSQLPPDVQRTVAMIIGWLMSMPLERRKAEIEFLENRAFGLH